MVLFYLKSLAFVVLCILTGCTGKTNSNHFSAENIQQAVVKFDVATVKESGMLPNYPAVKGVPFVQTETFNVLKQYSYSPYMLLYSEYLQVRDCPDSADAHSYALMKLFHEIQVNMYKTTAYVMLQSLENKMPKAILCHGNPMQDMPNGEKWTQSHLYFAKAQRLLAVMRNTTF